jgi:hypothetical protein
MTSVKGAAKKNGMGRVAMGRVSVWRRKRLSSALWARDFAPRQPVAESNGNDIVALRRAIGPGLVDVALFRR